MCGCGFVCVRSDMDHQHVCEQFGKHVSTGEQFIYFISQSTENETKKAPAFVYKMVFKDLCDLQF